jgi:ATP-dependent Clp protease adapter protein ClpS
MTTSIFLAVTTPHNGTITHPGRVESVAVDDQTSSGTDQVFQVVLHNDDHNEGGYVADCLVRVFKHPPQLAWKIMLEAHHNGRSIAEVESETPATKHRDQLRSLGLSATVEKV